MPNTISSDFSALKELPFKGAKETTEKKLSSNLNRLIKRGKNKLKKLK